MKYALLFALTVGCVGCASSQHKHPHDHGLSAIQGNQRQLGKDISRLAGYLRVQQMELAEHNTDTLQLEGSLNRQIERIDALKKRTAGLTVVDFEIVKDLTHLRGSIEQLKTHIANVASNHYTHTAKADRNIEINREVGVDLMKTLASLEKRLAAAEKMIKPPEQKLIELPKEDEEEKEEAWDGKALEKLRKIEEEALPGAKAIEEKKDD